MKQTVKKLLKSGICLMLVFCMLLSFAPATALTAQAAQDEQDEQDKLIYVSIGDSMTNGYCLPGYDGVSGAINYAMETYSNKFAAYLAGYDGPIVDNQVIFEGDKRTVDHRQLAISGMRAQDIQWILELNYLDDALIQDLYDNNDYKKDFNYSQFSSKWYGDWKFNTAGDFFTYSELIDSKYRYADAAARIVTTYFDEQGDGFEYYESEKKYNEAVPVDTIVAGVAAEPAYPQGAQEAAMGANYLRIATEFYQKSMADADIISLGVGNTNFGTFMLNKITNLIMGGDMSFSQNYDINKAIIQAKSNPVAWEKVKAMVGDPDNNWAGVSQEYQIMEYAMTQLGGGYAPYEAEIQYILKYAMITFMSGYIGMLDAILELNPDAQIIMIALMNSYAEDNGTTEGTVSKGTLGELVQYIYTPVNAFLKNLAAEYDGSHEYAKFYFAEAPYVSCMVDVFGDDYYKDVNGNFVEYKGLLNERDVQTGELLNPSEGYTANVGGVVRERFAEEILKNTEDGGYFFPNIKIEKTVDDIRPFLYGGEVTFTVEGKSVVEDTCGVIAYDMMTPVQKAYYAAANPNSAQEYAYYLAFENALIMAGTKNITMKSLGGLGTIEESFKTAVGDIKALIGANSKNYYADAAVVVAAGSGGALTEEDVVNIMMAVEQVKAGVWADAAEYHETLATSTEDGGLGHPTIDHILQCDKCMDTNAGEHYANPIIKAIVDAYNEQMAELPYVIVTEMVKKQAGDFLTVGDIKTLCQTGDSAAYKDAVYAMIIAKAAENHFTMTNEHIDLLITEDGAFKVASLIAMKDTKYANMIKNAYYDEENAGTDADPLEPDQRANITMLLGVRDGVITLLASESTLKNGAEGIPVAIENATLLAMLLAQPKTMSEGLNANEGLQGALTMNARCLVGTGAGAHPSTDGHQALYKAVFDAFDFCSVDGHTPVHGTPEVIEGLTHGKIVCRECGETIETFIYGDVNGDGAVNGKDVTVLRKYQLNEWSGKYIAAAADMDGNGTVDGKDVTRLRKYLINEYVITIK